MYSDGFAMRTCHGNSRDARGSASAALGAPKHAYFDEHLPIPAAAVLVGGGDAAARARQLSSGRGHDGGGEEPVFGKNRARKRDGRRGGVFFPRLWSCWRRLHCSTCRPRRRWHAGTLNRSRKNVDDIDAFAAASVTAKGFCGGKRHHAWVVPLKHRSRTLRAPRGARNSPA